MRKVEGVSVNESRERRQSQQIRVERGSPMSEGRVLTSLATRRLGEGGSIKESHEGRNGVEEMLSSCR